MMDAMMVKRAMPKMACMKSSSSSSRIRANRNRQNRYKAKHPGYAGTRVSWNSPSEQIRNGPMLSSRLVDHPDPPTVLKDQRAREGGQGDDDEEDDLEPFAQEHLAQLCQLKFAHSTQAACMESKISKYRCLKFRKRGPLIGGGGALSTFDIYLLIVNCFERLHTRKKKFRSSSETEPTFCDMANFSSVSLLSQQGTREGVEATRRRRGLEGQLRIKDV